MSGQPTTGHTAKFRPGAIETTPDGRMVSATFKRNVQPVIDGLAPLLAGRKGAALEIGSGTGQHIVAFAKAFPNLHWTPSDPDAVHRKSINAWRAHESAGTSPALALDAAADWASSPGFGSDSLQLIISMNVIHISPIAVLHGIVKGAGQTLQPGGLLVFYGPFKEGGMHTGDGNAAFDTRLRTDNPDWGVRDTTEITKAAQQHQLRDHALIPMPANNRLLVLAKEN